MSSQNIKLAKFAGFCYGVKRAVETAKKLKSENPDKNVYVLGELIHNMDVIRELDELGIKTIYEIEWLTNEVLKRRFSCQKSHSLHGSKILTNNLLINIETLANNPEFAEILEFINTKSNNQKKGTSGFAK